MARGRKSSWHIVLSSEEHQTLARWQRATTLTAGSARRGKIVLLLAAEYSQSAVAPLVGVPRTAVRTWAKRLLTQRLDGLSDAHGRGAKDEDGWRPLSHAWGPLLHAGLPLSQPVVEAVVPSLPPLRTPWRVPNVLPRQDRGAGHRPVLPCHACSHARPLALCSRAPVCWSQKTGNAPYADEWRPA